MLANYYYIGHTTNYKKVGNVFPQVLSSYTNASLIESLKDDQQHYREYKSMDNLFGKPVGKNIVLGFSLERKAKLTDVLSLQGLGVGQQGLLISERFYLALEGFTFTSVDFIPSLVHNGNDQTRYVYVYPRWKLVDTNIDFANTVFVVTDFTDENFRLEYKVNNLQHFRQRMDNSTFRRVRTKDGVYLTADFPTDDIIKGLNFKTGIYISERLKKRLEEFSFTGVDIGEEASVVGMKEKI